MKAMTESVLAAIVLYIWATLGMPRISSTFASPMKARILERLEADILQPGLEAGM